VLEGDELDAAKFNYEELKLQMFCEEQLVMKTEKGEQFVWYYDEAFKQLGFIAFFAFVFPAAPLFSFITNFLEIRIKLQSMKSYSKRRISEGAKGIGSWLGIMELISMICIPVNVAMVFWLGYKGEKSVFVKFLEGRDVAREAEGLDPIWTNVNMLLLLIFMEHVILFLKAAVAALIPDVPESVLFEEWKNDKIGRTESKNIQQYKLTHKLNNYEDMLNELKKEAEDQIKLCDGTRVGGKKWSALKEKAMQDDFELQEWFIELERGD
jgi:hypothetical protein